MFPFFSAYELFKMRCVSSEWRDMVRSMWHLIFKREMFEQLLVADLCAELQSQFDLIKLRTPFYHKLGMCLKALIEIVEWDRLELILQKEDVDIRIKLLLVTFFKMIGTHLPMESLSDF